MILTPTLRRFLQGADRSMAPGFQKLNAHFDRAQLLVRGFYLISAALIYQAGMRLHMQTQSGPEIAPRWPIVWFELVPLQLVQIVDVIAITGMVFAMLALWQPWRRTFRAGYALCLLFTLAIPPSLGGTNHADHVWFWVALCFVFLPASTDSRIGKMLYCQTFAMAQGLVLFFYSLAGMWKIAFGLVSLMQGEEGNFSPRGLALTLADRMVQTNTQPLLGPLLVEHYWLSWPLFLGLIYAQFVALAIVFRPSLHIAWGLILIGFHTGTFLLMEISFPTHIMVLLLLLVASPFAQREWLQWRTLRNLPGAGLVNWLWPASLSAPDRGQRAAAI